MRTGTGRNNISYGGGSTTKGQYLKRTANGRNDISFINIQSNGTHKLLERTATSINSIRWNNLSFSFFTQYESTYKSSTTITIPSGCTKIDIFCVGGGGGGCRGHRTSDAYGGGGGGGGCTKTVSNVSVSSGQSISIVIGSGGNGANSSNNGDGSVSSVSRSGTVLATIEGGEGGYYESIGRQPGGDGGSGGGGGGGSDKNEINGGNGGANGGDGYTVSEGSQINDPDIWEYGYCGYGQGTTTRAWGSSSGTLYAGGGGAGGYYGSDSSPGASGGSGIVLIRFKP